MNRWLFSGFMSLAIFWTCAVEAASTHPYYRRRMPTPQKEADFASDTYHIDLSNAHLPPYGVSNTVAEANRLFDARAAAAVRAAVGTALGVRLYPNVKWIPHPDLRVDLPYLVEDITGNLGAVGEHLYSNRDLLEMKWYGRIAPTIYVPRAKCLAALAYLDYFPVGSAEYLRGMVSEAILAARPGWCGSFGPGVDSATDLAFNTIPEGNYNMSQMHLLPMIYRYYDELSPAAREHLINYLLKDGRIHRPGVDDHFTSGVVPVDWRRAGFVSPLGIHQTIGETENHILTILTARYLSNQLLYQRNPALEYDNRRNGNIEVLGKPVQVRPHCTELMLTLLQRILRDDFSEYNAKNYQAETRWALLNLCTYAYDHEVRLAARMVLDYVSARIAISSSDLRRMVPFRRRNEGKYVTTLMGANAGFMDIGLLDWTLGADPMAEYFAMQAGNTRAYETPNSRMPSGSIFEARIWAWGIASEGSDVCMEVLSDYRLPPSIHDLFVNDSHRRFFQRLHRTPRPEEVASGRNCDNMEIYAGSPSYLITAGGESAPWAVFPGLAELLKSGSQNDQLGVAVTTSFMPTGQSAGPGTQNNTSDLIQFSSFSDVPRVRNYGVAPDFACGHKMYYPPWLTAALETDGQFRFVNKGSTANTPAGFYLAIYDNGTTAFLEAFDTWLHPEVTFQDFKRRVKAANPNINIRNNVEAQYTTQNGNQLHFVIWNGVERDGTSYGAKILNIGYGAGHPNDTLIDAGNNTAPFLSGTIMNSPAEAVVEITNPALKTKLTLDMKDLWRPRRIAENGEVEEAGSNHEVWVDFAWTGPNEGDFFRPFNTLFAAVAAVAEGGVIKIMPGSTREKPFITKRVKLVAPIGGVSIGVL